MMFTNLAWPNILILIGEAAEMVDSKALNVILKALNEVPHSTVMVGYVAEWNAN